MAERIFEMQLERLFAEAPALPDADGFAAKVAERLDRGWTFRRLLIGGLGIAGGLIGGAQMLGSGLVGRVGAVGVQSHDLADAVGDRLRLADWPVARGFSGLLGSGASMDVQVLWMSAALGLLAAGLFLTRAIREI